MCVCVCVCVCVCTCVCGVCVCVCVCLCMCLCLHVHAYKPVCLHVTYLPQETRFTVPVGSQEEEVDDEHGSCVVQYIVFPPHSKTTRDR